MGKLISIYSVVLELFSNLVLLLLFFWESTWMELLLVSQSNSTLKKSDARCNVSRVSLTNSTTWMELL